MGVRSTIPTPVAKPQAAPQKYPMMVLEGEYQGKPTIRVTNNEKNFKWDTFNGGANKLKNLFADDKDGDVIIASLIGWLIKQGAMTQDEAVTWLERTSQQLSNTLAGNIPV
jgi:hypothetical protein